jgi:hypothetical protein
MQPRDWIYRAAAIGVTGLALAACGGDSGGGNADAKQNVIRELGQLSYFVQVAGPLFGKGLSPFDPAAAPPETCEQGVGIATEGEGRRTFDFYSTSPIVSFTRYEFENCRVGATIGDAPAQLEYEGEVETGSERDNDPSNLADSSDYYVEYGAGGEPLVLERIVRDVDGLDIVEESSDRLTGSAEWRYFDYGLEQASVLVRLLERTAPEAYTLVWLQGESGDPLRAQTDPSSRLVSFEGPYTYNSSRCTGGSRRITTVQDLERDDAYPVGGEIDIQIGATVLSIAFTQDGASARFDDGAAVTLTAEEVRAALDEPAC